MFGIGKLLEAAVKTVVVLPVSVVADVVTGCGLTNDRDSYTVEAIESIKEDIDQIGD